MTEDQFAFTFDLTPATEPAVSPDLRDEIAGVWGLPLGEKVEVFLRNSQIDTVSGILELADAPDYPWNPRQPLRLRIAGFVFSNREIGHWTRL